MVQQSQQSPDDNKSSDSAATNTSESATLMSKHAMKMGFYTINLGTETGQRLHSCHLVILPLIPIIILLMQYTTAYSSNINKITKASYDQGSLSAQF